MSADSRRIHPVPQPSATGQESSTRVSVGPLLLSCARGADKATLLPARLVHASRRLRHGSSATSPKALRSASSALRCD